MNIVSIKQKFDKSLRNNNRFNLLNRLISYIVFFNSKYSNYFLNNYEYIKKKTNLDSYPLVTSLNTTNLCNYRCLFCEIHFFYEFAKKFAGKVFSNHIDVSFITKFEKMFDKTISIELSGASGEPLVNPNFLDLCKKLKEKKIITSITTNGALLDKAMAESLIDINFDNIMVSLHSGEIQNYNELQGGNLNIIIENLKNLVQIRGKKGAKLPIIAINCLIFTLNMHSIKKLIETMKKIGVDKVNINHYYASRNKISQNASFFFNPEKGNNFLTDLYQHAKSLDFKLTPEKPSFIKNEFQNTDSNNSNICDSPWKSIKFKGCVQYENSQYVGVCNRILLFRLNYEEFEGDFIKDIWNNEIVRYFRKTVMKNTICKFCRSSNTPKLRCLNNKQYQMNRDKVIRAFFKEVFETIKIKPRKGIYLLKKNPYEYVDYYERHEN